MNEHGARPLTGPFTLCTLDGVVLAGTEGPVPARIRLLLALLSVQRHGWQRAQLAGILFPDLSEAAARASLRQLLFQLRAQTGGAADWLMATRDWIGLRRERCSCDHWAFEKLALSEQSADWSNACRHYRRDLCVDLDGDIELPDVLLGLRQHLRQTAHRLAERILQSQPGADPHEAAIALCERLIASEPTDEAVCATLMRLYRQAGQPALADAAFQRCADALRRQLGVEPERLPQELAPVPASSPSPSARGSQPGQAELGEVIASSWNNYALARELPAQQRALDHLLRGWQLFTQMRSAANREARTEFQIARQADPENAEAVVMEGWTHFIDAASGWGDRAMADCLDRAQQCLDQRPAGQAGGASELTLQGKLHLWWFRFDAALGAMNEAVRVAPGNAYAYFHLADAMMWSGLYPEALRQIDRALRLDANDHGMFLSIQCMAMLGLGQLGPARASAERAQVRNPHYVWPYASLSAIAVELGDQLTARTAMTRTLALHPRFSLDFASQALPLRDEAFRSRLLRDWRIAGFPQSR